MKIIVCALKHKFSVILCIKILIFTTVLDYVPHGDMFTLWTFHGAFPEALVQLYIAEICLVIGEALFSALIIIILVFYQI